MTRVLCLALLLTSTLPCAGQEPKADDLRIVNDKLHGSLEDHPLGQGLVAVASAGRQSLVVTPQRLQALDTLRVCAQFHGVTPQAALRSLLTVHEIPFTIVEGVLVVTNPPPEPPRSARLRPGQRFVFSLASGAEMIWEVKRVGTTRVTYTVRIRVGDKVVGDPLEKSWDPSSNKRLALGSQATTELRLADDQRLRCLLVKSEGATYWLALEDGRPAFPGVVRIERGGKAELALVRMEAPK